MNAYDEEYRERIKNSMLYGLPFTNREAVCFVVVTVVITVFALAWG